MSDTPRNSLLIDGPVGQIELLIDHPAGPPKGGLVSHPQPRNRLASTFQVMCLRGKIDEPLAGQR